MIKGIGLDIVEIDRFRTAMRNGGVRFMRRVFSASENADCRRRKDPAPHYAARFAAKEAVLKALGTGWSRGIAWTDIKIFTDRHGAPGVRISGMARKIARQRGIAGIHISLTHTSTSAAAVAIGCIPQK